MSVGIAEVDITPDYPVRLSGFGGRRTESEGVTLKIWAKSLAFADEKEGPAILITTENVAVSDETVRVEALGAVDDRDIGTQLLCDCGQLIAVPLRVAAALLLALPTANPTLSLTAVLGVTFPFNLTLGLPLYLGLARWLYGG